jgi:hypothetical protein
MERHIRGWRRLEGDRNIWRRNAEKPRTDYRPEQALRFSGR